MIFNFQKSKLPSHGRVTKSITYTPARSHLRTSATKEKRFIKTTLQSNNCLYNFTYCAWNSIINCNSKFALKLISLKKNVLSNTLP